MDDWVDIFPELGQICIKSAYGYIFFHIFRAFIFKNVTQVIHDSQFQNP